MKTLFLTITLIFTTFYEGMGMGMGIGGGVGGGMGMGMGMGGPAVPIDTGAGIILFLGLLYGSKRIYDISKGTDEV